MAEASRGRALRAYQLLMVLALGWAGGRLPHWLDEGRAEAARIGAVVAPAAVAEEPADADSVALAAEVAARVAAEVADQTVARLIAAGWGPQSVAAPVQRIVVEHGPLPRQETLLRVRAEPGGGGAAGWSLPLRAPDADGVTPPPATKPAPPAVEAATAPGRVATPAAHATAEAGYAAIRAGRLPEGVRLLKTAQAMDPDAAEAKAWGADVQQLTRRWSVAAYTVSRAGTGEALAASPALGGGQSAAAVGYRLNPLGRQRLSVIGRVSAAAGPDGAIDSQTGEAAVGLRWEPSRKLPVAVDVERRIALGLYSRNAWAARVSGGGQGRVEAWGRPVTLDGYAEAGVVEGFTSSLDLYGGAQARGSLPLFRVGRTSFEGGAGAWGASQRSGGLLASRLDMGPSARIRVEPWPFHAQIDWRARVAGNALPGSGPVLTVAGEF